MDYLNLICNFFLWHNNRYIFVHNKHRNVVCSILRIRDESVDNPVPWMSGLVGGLQNRLRRFESARNLYPYLLFFIKKTQFVGDESKFALLCFLDPKSGMDLGIFNFN